MSSSSASSCRASRSWPAPARPAAMARLTPRTISNRAAKASGVPKSSSRARKNSRAAVHDRARQVRVVALAVARDRAVQRAQRVGEPLDDRARVLQALLREGQPRAIVAGEEVRDHHLGGPAVEHVRQRARCCRCSCSSSRRRARASRCASRCGPCSRPWAALGLRDLVLVVREDQVDAAAVDLEPRGPGRSRPWPSTRCASRGGPAPTATPTRCPRPACAPSRARSPGATPCRCRARPRPSRPGDGPTAARSPRSARRGSRRRRRLG